MEQFGPETPTGDEPFPTTYSRNKIGLILDVENSILNQLISSDKEKNFLLNFFKDLNSIVITLINGNQKIPYYPLDNFLKSSTDSLKDYYYSNNSYSLDSVRNFFPLFGKASISEIITLENYVERIKNSLGSFGLIDSEMMIYDILNLKDIMSKNYSHFNQSFLGAFDHFISQRSSPIILSLTHILKLFSKSNTKSKFNYIIIITDGKIKENSYNMHKIVNKAKEDNITIITILLKKDKNGIRKKFYTEFPKDMDKNLKNLFDVSSKVNYRNPLARQFIKKNWDFPKDKEGTLLFETNLENLKEFADNFKKTKDEDYEIIIDDLNLKNYVHFKFKFHTKNQIFGTCWANAYSEAIFLANKRVLGRKIKSYETYRENLIKYACSKYDDGGEIYLPRVEKYFKDNGLHFEKITEKEVQDAMMKGRFVICHFSINDVQWDNFCNFFRKHKDETLTKEEINKKMDPNKKETSGHAVLLVEWNKDYLKFLNSWGYNFAKSGTFKVKNGDVLASYYTDDVAEFFDIYYTVEDLSKEEQKYYSKNVDFVCEILDNLGEITMEKIINHYNNLSNEFFKCKKCSNKSKIDYYITSIEDGLHKVKCPGCDYFSEAEGKLKELLILKNIMQDGNDDFDLNYEEKDYIDIRRVPFHKNFSKNFDNESDLCTIGLENIKQKNIESLFDKKLNSVIWLENNIFMAAGSGEILVFRFDLNHENTNEFLCMMEKSFPDDDILTLCNLNCNNLIATGGKNLKILKINYEINYLTLEKTFEKNKGINKIVLIEEENSPEVKWMAVCDKMGNIGIYTIIEDEDEVYFYFNNKCHNSSIDCILYIPEDDMLVSGSNKERKLCFWEIQSLSIKRINKYEIVAFPIHNNSLSNIKEYLLVGELNGVRVFKHENRGIITTFFLENGEFGGVFSIKHIQDDYFICGRAFGFCSIFRKRYFSIRKINIFRNNNLRSSNDEYDFDKDNYYITDICCVKTSDNDGYILTTSADRTLKVYEYEIELKK